MRLLKASFRRWHTLAWLPFVGTSLWLLAFTAHLGHAQVLSNGPVIGGVNANHAKIFVRTSAAASVVVQYGTDSRLSHPASSSPISTTSSHDFTAIVPISPLTELTTYYLNVLVNGVPQLAQPYPSFATFPRQGTPSNFKFAVVVDFKNLHKVPQNTPAFANAAAEDPAFTFIGGDFDHSNPETLAAHRSVWRRLYNPASPDMADFVDLILLKMPVAHQWDDHDSGMNNDDKTFPFWANAYQAFKEYMPMYTAPAPAGSFGIWQKFSYGQAEFFILDCRSQRDNEYAIDDINKSMLDGRHLGAAGELEWLENGLLASSATWKVLFSSVPTNPTTKFPDGWAGYQTEWSRLRSFIQQHNIKNVVFISGDLHIGGIDNGTASGFPEMVVGTINGTKQPTCATSRLGRWSQGVYAPVFPTPCSQYGVVTVTTDPDQMLLQIKDETGTTKLSHSLNGN